MRSTVGGPVGPQWRARAGVGRVLNRWGLALAVVAGLGFAPGLRAGAAWARPTVSPTALVEFDHRTALGDGGTQALTDALPGESAPRAAFHLTRFRTGVRLVEGRLNVRVTAELLNGRLVPFDASGHWQLDDAFRVEAGVLRGPFGALFYREPLTTQPFSERAAVELAFRQRTDLGVGLNWEPVDLPLAANVRVGNGSGPEGWQPAAYLVLEGRFGRAHRADADAFWGLWLGVSGQHEVVRARRSATFNSPFGVPVLVTAPVEGVRSLADAHAVVWLGSVRVRLEAAYASEERGQDLDESGNARAPRAAGPVRSRGLIGELNWVVRGGARLIGLAPSRPAEGPAIELSARVERLWFDLDDTRWHQAMSTGNLAVKAWVTDWWAVALVGFGQTGFGGVQTSQSDAATRPINEAGIYLRSSFFYAGNAGT